MHVRVQVAASWRLLLRAQSQQLLFVLCHDWGSRGRMPGSDAVVAFLFGHAEHCGTRGLVYVQWPAAEFNVRDLAKFAEPASISTAVFLVKLCKTLCQVPVLRLR